MFSILPRPEDNWRREGACFIQRERVQELNKQLGYDIFYPDRGNSQVANRLAMTFCNQCPVRVKTACFTAGIGEQGTWGGETEKSRRRLVRKFRIDPLMLAKQQEEQLQDENINPNEVSNLDHESA